MRRFGLYALTVVLCACAAGPGVATRSWVIDVAFANYSAAETKPVRVDGMREFRLKLLVSGFVVEPGN